MGKLALETEAFRTFVMVPPKKDLLILGDTITMSLNVYGTSDCTGEPLGSYVDYPIHLGDCAGANIDGVTSTVYTCGESKLNSLSSAHFVT